MHTVPAGYLRAFADIEGARKKPHLWQYDRIGQGAELVSIKDASVSRGIYNLKREDGTSDQTIETDLLATSVDARIPHVARLLASGGTPRTWEWRDLSRFMAFQLARVPQMFQLFRDEGMRRGVEIGVNDPQLAMVFMAPQLEKWICAMEWTICDNGSAMPFLTSDAPVVMWADRGDGAELGVGFTEPALQITFPLTPKLSVLCKHTEASITAVREDDPTTRPRFTDLYRMQVSRGRLELVQALRSNLLVATNAHRFVYANNNDLRLQLFLKEHFIGQPGPVRRSDRKPIGSPIDPTREPIERLAK